MVSSGVVVVFAWGLGEGPPQGPQGVFWVDGTEWEKSPHPLKVSLSPPPVASPVVPRALQGTRGELLPTLLSSPPGGHDPASESCGCLAA